MNKTLSPVSWLFMACLFGFLNASYGEETPPEPAPNSPVTFSDRFFTDTRGNYRVVGTVDWELGTLKLSPASAVARIEPLLPTFQCEIHMWPKGSTAGKDVNVTRLTVPTAAGYELVIAIFRQEQQGRLLVQVILGEIERRDQSGKEAPQVTELRRLPAFALTGEIERWRIDYNHGIIRLSCNGQAVGQAYSSAFAAWCQAIVVQQETGNLEISRIDLTGKHAGYTPEQRVLYQEARTLRAQADEAWSRGETSEAIRLESSRLPLLEKAFGKDDYSLGLVFGRIAELYSLMEQPQQAIENLQKSGEAFRRSLGENHPEAIAADILAAYELMLTEVMEAEKLIRPAFQKMLAIAGPGSYQTMTAANRLRNVLLFKSDVHAKRGEHAEEANCLRERIELMTTYEPGEKWNILLAKRDHETAAEVAAAESSKQKKMVEWRKKCELLVVAQKEGRIMELGKTIQELIDTSRELFGEEHRNTLFAMSCMAHWAGETGDPGLAISLSESVVDYWRKHGEEHDPQLVDALIALAVNYSVSDRHDEAEKLFKEAATSCYHAKQLESEPYARCLLERGRNQIRFGNNAEAKTSLTHALKIFSDIGQSAGWNAIKTRERLADICRAEGDMTGADRYLAEQRYLTELNFGKTSAAYIEVVRSEAQHLFIRGKFPEAVKRFEEALALTKDGYGEDSRLYYSILEALIEARAWQGNDAQASQEFLRLVDSRRNNRESLFSAYPERLQFDRVLLDRDLLSTVLELAATNRISATDAYQRVLDAKGSVMTYQRALRLGALNSNSKEIVAQLRTLASQIANQLVQPPGAKQQADLQGLLKDKEKLESQLAQQSRDPGKSVSHVTVKQVQESLPKNAALVDYVEYRRRPTLFEQLRGKTRIPAILAFVVTNERDVQLVTLGDLEPVDDAAIEWYAAINEEINVAEKDAGHAAVVVDELGVTLRKLVWDPLEKFVEDSSTIIVSPDAVLVACPFAALPLDNNQGFLIEKKAIVHTPAASTLPELLNRDPEERAEKAQLLLVNDVEYGKSVANNETDETPFLQLPPDEEGLQLLQKEFRGRHPTGEVKTLSGAKAEEDEFKKRVEEARFVHLVTHGFCRRASDIHLSPEAMGTQSADLASDPIVSGIAFANANQGILSNASNDGVLWADEISTLNLQQSELVVLFACESAIGSYAAGEGMLGCQRALSVAGAQASMGTLWSVRVGASRELMKQFYHNLWELKLSKSEALQSGMIHLMWAYPEPRESTLGGMAVRCPPALWSGFVLSGNWR